MPAECGGKARVQFSVQQATVAKRRKIVSHGEGKQCQVLGSSLVQGRSCLASLVPTSVHPRPMRHLQVVWVGSESRLRSRRFVPSQGYEVFNPLLARSAAAWLAGWLSVGGSIVAGMAKRKHVVFSHSRLRDDEKQKSTTGNKIARNTAQGGTKIPSLQRDI